MSPQADRLEGRDRAIQDERDRNLMDARLVRTKQNKTKKYDRQSAA